MVGDAADWDGCTRVSPSRRIEELQAEARYARARFDLYRAKMYGLRPTTLARLRELERMREGADARLRRALEEDAGHGLG